MRDTDLLQLALGLLPPWMVKAATFDAQARRLDIEIDFARGGRFPCPHCAKADCPVHDTAMQTWRHLDFFQHQAFLHARTPRITCPDCGVKQIAVPWARAGSGFTLLFEALAMTLMTAMPVAAAARLMGEHDTRMWRVLHHWVEQARERADYKDVSRVAIDETAAKRGHDYVSLFVDIDQRRVLFVTEGRGADTVAAFADDLEAHNGDASRVRQVCIDMSAAFIKGVTDNLTEAEITFDKFHAVKLVNDAVDKVRRAEAKGRPELKRSPLSLAPQRALAVGGGPRQSAGANSIAPQDGARLPDPPRLPGDLPAALMAMGRLVPRPLVQLGHPIAPRTGERRRTHYHAPPRRHPQMVHIEDRQWPHRGHQQSRASRQGQGARLSLDPKPQGHRLSDCRQTRPQAAHMK